MPSVVSGQDCNEAHNEDLKRRISRHISATQTTSENNGARIEDSVLVAGIPADLAALASIWSKLAENIRAAILALAALKP